MNKLITVLFCALAFFTSKTGAQTSTEIVNFDNYVSVTDNDFANWFSGGNGLTQITTNGISGGCLSTPDSVNWGNDEANYCFKYKGGDFASNSTRFNFKYDSTLTNLPSYARCASIWLKPSADFNHYIVASVSHQKKLEILTYSWTNNGAPSFTLTHGNWYQLVLFLTYSSGGSINVAADLFDLGPSGLFSPSLVDHQFGGINDTVFSNDTAVQIGISGSLKGGAKYIDDFKFIGQKSSDSCAFSIPNSIEDIANSDKFIFYNENNSIQLLGAKVSAMKVEIINLEGKIIETQSVNGNFSFNATSLASGIYFLKAKSVDGNFVKQFAVIK